MTLYLYFMARDYPFCDNLITRKTCEVFQWLPKGWSLLYPPWLDLRPGSWGGHWVTKVFHKWSPGHGAKIAIPRLQSTNMDEVVRHVREVKY